MRSTIFFILILIAFHWGSAQSVPRLLNRANEMFEADRFLDAIEYYEKIVGIDKANYFARYRLGYCYNQTLQYGLAKNIFLRLGEEPNHEYRARGFYNYANILKLESQFEMADSIFTYLISLPDVDQDLIELSRKQREGCLLALRQEQVDKGYRVELMDDINSSFHDFGAVVNPTNKRLVLATTRNLPGVQYEGSQYVGLLPDLAVYENVRNGRWRLDMNEQNFSRLNTQWAEGAGSFTKDGTKFYYSSCRGENGTDCAIMVSNLLNDTWTEPTVLNEYINEPSAENKHPFISQSGDTLFFISDRPGGIGGSDIWMSLKGLEEESWTPAINMGEVINSPENEITPYYSSAFSCLIFASNGHVGYGGYDLYAAKGESFFEPEIYNLGDPFNSTLDDTYFAISDTVGFLSSNREDQKILNLYSFAVNNERLFLSLLISGESLIESQIISKFRDVRTLDLITFRVEDYQGYELFEPVKREKPKPPIVQAAEEEEKQKQDSIMGFTDSDAIAGRSVITTQDLFGNNRTGDIHFEKLFFTYGSSTLRPEVKIALESLKEQLSNQEYQSIEILAYTDHLGHDEFNDKLSEQRGNSVKDFLQSLGIPEDKMRVLPRGEFRPEGIRDHWFTRVFSRKVEVVVNTDQPIDLKGASSYLIRKEKTMDEIAALLGVGLADLENWNGARNKPLEAGYILRIFNDKSGAPNIKYFVEEHDMKHTFFPYLVKEGDTWQSIATKYNTMEELLAEINEMSDEPVPGEEVFVYLVNF